MSRRFSRLALLLSLVACAARQGEKGGLVALPVAQSQLDGAHAGKRLAVVVGIDHFADTGWRPLRFAVKDASDVGHALSDPAGGSFEVRTAGNGGGQVTRSDLLAQLDQLRQRNTSPEDVVVIYVSTHGTLARDAHGSLERYLVASDTHLDDVRHTGILLAELETALDALPSRKKVLILATCHSGAGKSLLPPEVLRELEGTKAPFFAAPLEDASRASIVLAACDWGETAREDEGLANDIYTHFFVEALLKPADRNGDGAVTATEAHDYARRKTYDFTGGQQRPSAQIQEVGAEPVVLHGRIDRVGLPEFFGYEAALDGFSVRVDGDEPLPLPGAVAVSAGSHRVQLAKGDGIQIYEGNVNVDLGQRVDLADLASHPEPLTSVAFAAGYQGFFNPGASTTLVGPGEALSLSVARDDLITRHIGLRGDLDVAGGERSLRLTPQSAAVPYFYTGAQLGASVPYQVRWGPLGAEIGPRVGAVYVRRSFDLSALHTHQDYLVVSPGLTAGLTLRVEARWFLFARVDAAAEAVDVDGESRWEGFGSGWFGVGFRP